MNYDTKDPQDIKDVLGTPKSQLGWLIRRAAMMQELQGLIHEILGMPLAAHTTVGNYENAVITLITHSATHATQLRFQSRDLLNRLHFYPKWGRAYKIEIKVKP